MSDEINDVRAEEPHDTGVDVAVACYFNPDDFLGGAERIAWAEADLLSDARRVVFISTSPPVPGTRFRQLRVGGWTRRLYQRPGPRRNPLKLVVLHVLNLFNPFVLAESIRVFRRLRPRVVHTHNLVALSPAVWLAARMSGAEVIHTHQDLWLLCERATMTDAEGRPCNESLFTCHACRALRPAKRLLLGHVSCELFPSRWLRDRLARRGPVVRNFSTSSLPPKTEATTPAPTTVVYIGGLTPHKIGPLLEAFSVACESGPPMELVIAGAGPLEGQVMSATRSSSNVRYVGQVDSDGRNRLLGDAAAVVIPSTCAETSPLVFFEAVAAGVPVIASDIGGITELESWGNVVLVPPGDPNALARAISELLADENRLSALRANASRHRAEAAPERFVRQLDAVLLALEEDRRASAAAR
jgi:glycosyltransferase involved in cell wall biosynthesis